VDLRAPSSEAVAGLTRSCLPHFTAAQMTVSRTPALACRVLAQLRAVYLTIRMPVEAFSRPGSPRLIFSRHARAES
jgi:hypothetical protein